MKRLLALATALTVLLMALSLLTGQPPFVITILPLAIWFALWLLVIILATGLTVAAIRIVSRRDGVTVVEAAAIVNANASKPKANPFKGDLWRKADS
jgi:hypothetical protein